MSADITPVRMDDGKYYMGIWVKDDLAGIGTITYYTRTAVLEHWGME